MGPVCATFWNPKTAATSGYRKKLTPAPDEALSDQILVDSSMIGSVQVFGTVMPFHLRTDAVIC